jgi:hypothetical protein
MSVSTPLFCHLRILRLDPSLRSLAAFLPTFVLLVGALPSATAAVHWISSAAELRETIDSPGLSAGDTVIWENGVYSGTEDFVFEGTGTAGAPITLRAETPGGVVFTGSAKAEVVGSYLILDGFHWKGATGVKNQVETRRAGSGTELSDYCIIRNCAFDDLQTTAPTKSRWVVLYGQDNIVENCSFVRKNSTGAIILVETSYLGSSDVCGHIIRNNYFYDVPSKAGYEDYTGDCEAIRIGVSTNPNNDCSVLVMNNYFVEANGEGEIISDKANNDSFYYNTFRRCVGALTLRSGQGAWVEGNYFLGENVSNTGGIRVSNIDHTIINNYFERLRGHGTRAALCIYGGNTAPSDPAGYQIYHYVQNLQVHFNTFIDCRQTIIFDDSKYSSDASYPLTGDATNNLVSQTISSSYDLIEGSGGTYFDPSNLDWAGNIMYTSSGSVGFSDSGITVTDPDVSLSGGLYRPDDSGAAADAATSDFSSLTVDVEGQSRDLSRDVGADEVSGESGPATGPIVDGDVGVTIGCSFLAAEGLAKFGGNPAEATPIPFLANSTQVVMEAEHFHAQSPGGGDYWVETSVSGGSGSGDNAIVGLTNDDDSHVAGMGARLDYWVEIETAGNYYLHVRGQGASWDENSVYLGDHDDRGTADDTGLSSNSSWVWSRTDGTSYFAAGRQVVNLWMREDGAIIDKLVLNQSSTSPSGNGPSESDRGLFQESGGTVVMEAEHFHAHTSAGGDFWGPASVEGASSTAPTTPNAVEGLPDDGDSHSVGSGARLEYRVEISTAGSYYIFIRGKGESYDENSVYLGFENLTGTADDTGLSSDGSWIWSRTDGTYYFAAGEHTITVWMREDGAVLDKLVVSTSGTSPSGAGPAESDLN